MKTQQSVSTSSCLPLAGEDLVDIPSEFITGRKTGQSKTLTEFSISDPSKRLIFDSFRKMVEDIDGKEYELEWGVFHITAVHHYKAHTEPGGDSYMGYYEPYTVIDRDEIDIVSVYDKVFDCERPTLPGILNAYAKRENF